MERKDVAFVQLDYISKPKWLIKKELKGTQSRLLVTTWIWLLILIALVIGIHRISFQTNFDTEVIIDPEKPIQYISDKFLSVAFDTYLIKNGWIQSNISSMKLLKAASALAPAYLRVGGTSADRLLFVPHPSTKQMQIKALQFRNQTTFIDDELCAEEGIACDYDIDNFIMSGEEWIQINNFSKSAGLNLLFDLNVLLRDERKWNSTNAQQLLKFSNDHGFEIAWQLGNEPNSFEHVFHTAVTADQLSDDFETLRKLLDSFPCYIDSLLVGPDVTRPTFLQEKAITYLKEFVQTIGDTINAVTWHQYYLNGRTATCSEFVNPETLNILLSQITAVKEITSKYLPNTPIWLSETSSAYGGGAPGLSDSFVAGFLWLDKLGIAAMMGIDVVIRQTLYNGHYSLLDINTLNPLPDWWLSVLFKTFVGHRVLRVKQTVEWGPTRLYCHCTHPQALHSAAGAITIYGLNLEDHEVHVKIRLPEKFLSKGKIFTYVLTGESGLRSRTVLLNGERLQLKPDGSLPPFHPIIKEMYTPLTLPPLSLVFWVLHGVDVPACIN